MLGAATGNVGTLSFFALASALSSELSFLFFGINAFKVDTWRVWTQIASQGARGHTSEGVPGVPGAAAAAADADPEAASPAGADTEAAGFLAGPA